ncbi:MAG: tetratricopeptide repeat protein [Firmicutes bacterium]|nr:tetratricopeptide repeat protein [Bacillota bacterium]
MFRKKDYVFMVLLPVVLYLTRLAPGDFLFNGGLVTVGLWTAFYAREAVVHFCAVIAAKAEKAGDIELVKKYYRMIVSLLPNSLSGMFAGGALCAMEGKWELAEQLFRRFLEKRPWDFMAGYNLGLVLFKQGKTDDAKKWLKTVLHFQPWHEHAHVVLGDAYHAEGDHEKAERHYQIAWRLGNRVGQLKMLYPELRGC